MSSIFRLNSASSLRLKVTQNVDPIRNKCKKIKKKAARAAYGQITTVR